MRFVKRLLLRLGWVKPEPPMTLAEAQRIKNEYMKRVTDTIPLASVREWKASSGVRFWRGPI